MPHIDISTIHLSKSELDALKGISVGVLPDKAMQIHLSHLRLIEWDYHSKAYRISPYGVEYLEYRKGFVSDQRWTRALAIAAVVISLIALLLEFDDRGYLEWLKPGKTHAAQLPLGQSELQ